MGGTAMAMDTDGCDEITKLLASHERVEEDAHSERKLIRASLLCAFFMVVELVGGYVSGSLAVMSDAAHLLSDLAGFMISVVAVRLGRIPGDKGMSYGYARAEIIGALVSTLLIWILAGVLLLYAFKRLFDPEIVSGPLMFLLGLIGLVVNLVLGVVLGAESFLHSHGHRDGHSHSHGHWHDDHSQRNHHHGNGVDNHTHGDSDPEYGAVEPSREKEGNFFSKLALGEGFANVNVRAAYIHVLGDLVQNIGVMIAAVFIWINPAWRFMDPLCTVLFVFLVVGTTVGVAKDSINVLMEGTPPGLKLEDIFNALKQVPGVTGVADIHVWSLTVGQPALSVHLNSLTKDQHLVLKGAQKALEDKFGVLHATIQINCTTEDCCDPQYDPLCVKEDVII